MFSKHLQGSLNFPYLIFVLLVFLVPFDSSRAKRSRPGNGCPWMLVPRHRGSSCRGRQKLTYTHTPTFGFCTAQRATYLVWQRSGRFVIQNLMATAECFLWFALEIGRASCFCGKREITRVQQFLVATSGDRRLAIDVTKSVVQKKRPHNFVLVVAIYLLFCDQVVKSTI